MSILRISSARSVERCSSSSRSGSRYRAVCRAVKGGASAGDANQQFLIDEDDDAALAAAAGVGGDAATLADLDPAVLAMQLEQQRRLEAERRRADGAEAAAKAVEEDARRAAEHAATELQRAQMEAANAPRAPTMLQYQQLASQSRP